MGQIIIGVDTRPDPLPEDPRTPGPSCSALAGHPYIHKTRIQGIQITMVQLPWQSIPTIYPSDHSE